MLSQHKFRMIGPATTSGRIVDIAVHPNNSDVFYVAAAYGGVWKTNNHGNTFSPIFDEYGTQSIGCIAIDKTNPNVIWVGTGENNNQRSVGYGNGLYKSLDGGKSFTNVGLKNSEHIGMIAIDPENSDIVYVAAYGPLWKSGGERGLYKTTDGGKTWSQIHSVSDNTGCNEIHIDAKNSNILYATYHQRRRHEWTYLGGGPESALYKSTDAGKTWRKLSSGLPAGDVGRISICIVPSNTDILYSVIEAGEGKGGVFVSYDKGETWSKQNDFSTAGNYYQEIMADPKNPLRFFIMDTYLKTSLDGGKTITNAGESNKHVDNHAIWINPENTKHWLVGCDGGLYETYDNGQNYHFFGNLSITQFYRASVDNAVPFYNIYGGTQDNNTLGGPSANGTANGIPNSDWFVTVGGDGFKSQIDPVNPDIVYSQWQYGGLIRYDKKTGEQIDIKPMPKEGEKAYRWNWDAPLIISNHNPAVLYFAANVVFKSTDRGNSWTVISPDLSQQIDRNKLKVMDRVWGIDGVAKNQSTSIYGNIVYLSESPLDQNILYAATDDGQLQMTTDGGKTWAAQKSFAGVPANSYVSAVHASKHNKNWVYAAFDNHRQGDFKPYLAKSIDGGKTWNNIASNLPTNGSVKSFAEDSKNANLLFAGTEFGFFVTVSGGKKWTPFQGGMPPIAIKDIVIQERENDLVLATFGRGFAVLDNYSVLRHLSIENTGKDLHVFPVRDAKLFSLKTPLGGDGKAFKGSSYFAAENPEYGAVFYYHVKNDYKTQKELRKEKEAKLAKDKKDVYYPNLDSLQLENWEIKPFVLVKIFDERGLEVRRLKSSVGKGMNKLVWNLRYAPTWVVTDKNEADEGPLVSVGAYKAVFEIVQPQNTNLVIAKDSMVFQVKSIYTPTLITDASLRNQTIVQASELRRQIFAANQWLSETNKALAEMKKSISFAGISPKTIATIVDMEKKLELLNTQLNGNSFLAKYEFETLPGIADLSENVMWNLTGSLIAPTETHRKQLQQAQTAFASWIPNAKLVDTEYQNLTEVLDKLKVPYTPGRKFFFK